VQVSRQPIREALAIECVGGPVRRPEVFALDGPQPFRGEKHRARGCEVIFRGPRRSNAQSQQVNHPQPDYQHGEYHDIVIKPVAPKHGPSPIQNAVFLGFTLDRRRTLRCDGHHIIALCLSCCRLGTAAFIKVSNGRFVMAITAFGEEWTQSSCPGGLGNEDNRRLCHRARHDWRNRNSA
jgi:hypothetical protein